MNVVIAAGGTAGHISPALALGRELADAHGADVRFAGNPAGQESVAVPAAGFAFDVVEAAPFVRGLSPRNLKAPTVVWRAVGRARTLVERSDVVVGMGGYVSVPVALAALRARRPLVLHEQNAIPGLANRLLAPTARSVGVAFAEAARRLPRRARTVVTGNPVRSAILAVRADRDRLAKEAVDELDLDRARRTVVVFGGSQGARRIDRAAVEAVHELADRADVQLLILAGAAHVELVRDAIPPGIGLLVRVRAFLERMELAYAVADLVVCRAGASSVAEIAVCGLPSVLVPYPYATAHHQDANARALADIGAAAIVSDESLTGALLASRVRALLADDRRLQEMGARAASWSRPDAARALARVVVGAVR